MNTRRYSFSTLSSLAVVLLLSGCGAGVVNPVTGTPTTGTNPVTPAATGTMVNDFGGHAPLVGAHIYMVQLGAPAAQVTAGNSPQTYGSVVKSLLTTNGQFAGQYPLGTGAGDQFVPAMDLVGQPFNYVTTDQYGQAFFTGDYTCDPGYPVMLVGYGGAPSYPGSGPNTIAVTAESVYLGKVGGVSGGIFTYKTATQLFYAGQKVAISINGSTGFSLTTGVTATGNGNANGPTSGVLSGNEVTFTSTGVPAGQALLTTSQFSVFVPGYNTFTGAGPGAGTVTGTPTPNAAATNLAVLGNCPTTGVANFGPASTAPISFIYMNEVSTTAAGYALAGFTNTNATSQTGYDEFHIGAPVGNLVGIQNAAVTAGLLYDITGASGTGTTPGNGESHVARTVTPNGGNGVVPQQLINTIANSLAACVDSNNTLASQSTACKTLGQYAQDNGYLDTSAGNTTHQSANIAQAAFSLARFPQGAGTATSTSGGVQTFTAGTATTASNFVTAIVNLPAGANTPFGPNYTTAATLNDLAIGINWKTAAAAIGEIASDAKGNIWIAQSGGVYQLSQSGALLGPGPFTSYTSASGSAASGANPGLAIGTTGTVYESATTGFQSFAIGSSTGTAAVGNGNGGGLDLTVDGNFVYQATNPTNFLSANFNKYNFAGAEQTGFPIASNIPIFPIYPATDNANYCAYAGTYMSPDQQGKIYTNSSGNGFVTLIGYTNQICQLSSAGALNFHQSFLIFTTPHNIAIDNGNNAWFGDSGVGQVKKLTPANVLTQTTGGTLSVPWGVAIDGANTTWVANSTNGSIIQFNNSGVAMTPTNLQGGAGFNTTGGVALNDFTNLAIDPSGNVWAAAVGEGYVVQYVGVAAPTTNPISLATANRTNGVMAGLTSSPVTAYTISGNVVTFTGANSFYVGEQVSLGQFNTATYFNGLTLTITSRTATTFTAAYTHANASSTTDPGLASAQN